MLVFPDHIRKAAARGTGLTTALQSAQMSTARGWGVGGACREGGRENNALPMRLGARPTAARAPLLLLRTLRPWLLHSVVTRKRMRMTGPESSVLVPAWLCALGGRPPYPVPARGEAEPRPSPNPANMAKCSPDLSWSHPIRPAEIRSAGLGHWAGGT